MCVTEGLLTVVALCGGILLTGGADYGGMAHTERTDCLVGTPLTLFLSLIVLFCVTPTHCARKVERGTGVAVAFGGGETRLLGLVVQHDEMDGAVGLAAYSAVPEAVAALHCASTQLLTDMAIFNLTPLALTHCELLLLWSSLARVLEIGQKNVKLDCF